jgi:hypothetical protein
MSGWPPRKSFNQLCFNKEAMMTNHEQCEQEKNIDEIVYRLSDLLVNMMLMSIKKISNDQRFLMSRMQLHQDDELKF